MMKRYENYYEFVAMLLTAKKESLNLNTSQLARRVGEQYNTVKGIELGRRFSSHHTLWIEDFLSESLTKLYTQYLDNQGVTGDKEIKEEGLSIFL